MSNVNRLDSLLEGIRLRIAHLINSLATGGAERMVVELARYAMLEGHEVQVVVLQDVRGLPYEAAVSEGIPIKVVGKSLKDPAIPLRLRSVLLDWDICHVHLFPAMYWGATIPGKKVFTEHSTQNRRIGRAIFKLPERLIYDAYDAIIAISGGVENRILAHSDWIGSRTPIMRATNGIANEFFQIERPPMDNDLNFVSVGSLTPVKQHHLAIEAVSQIPNATLEIAGEGPLRGTLEAKIAELGLQNRVRLIGQVQDVAKMLAQKDALLSTSKYEGFSLVAAEAQAVGLPVIGPNVEGFNNVVCDGVSGLLFSSAEPKAIADLMMRATASGTYERLRAGARKNAQRFSMQVSFSENIAVYREVINQRAKGRS